MLKWTIYILLGVVLLSCHNSNKDCGGSGDSPILDVSIEGSIKINFEAGDKIGLFPVEYVEGIPGTLGDVRNLLNIPYRFDGEYWSADGGDDIFLEGNMTDIYAYYPYDSEISSTVGKTNLRAYPFDLSGDQSVKQTDFLWAKATAITPTENYAKLVFNHVFTHFIINLNYNDSDPTDASLEIHNTFPYVTIDLSSGVVTPINERGEIIPMLLEEATDGYDLTYSAIVAPGFVSAGTPIFSMDNQEDTSLFYLASDFEFRPGYTYTFNLIIGSLEVEPLDPPVVLGLTIHNKKL